MIGKTNSTHCMHAYISFIMSLTTSDFSEKTFSLMLSGANHLMGSLTKTFSSCLKYCLDVPMLSDRPKSATLMTKLTSILMQRNEAQSRLEAIVCSLIIHELAILIKKVNVGWSCQPWCCIII